jgi:phosphoserine phosphatase
MGETGGTLRREVLDRVLNVARGLGASADLEEILSLVIDAMRDLLGAERATVFEYDAATSELFTTVAHGIEPIGATDDGDGGLEEIRMPATLGLAGECAQTRDIINVPDAYADERFNRSVDKQTGFRTRSMLNVPLIGHDGELIGVAQVLNRRGGPFTADDEAIARALAAQAAVAMKRGRLIEDRLVRQKLERDLELAELIQRSSFPASLPELAGFDLHAWSEPAEETGGDAYDVVAVADPAAGGNVRRALVLIADATGHGVGPALSVTQLRSMFRMAARLGADVAPVVEHLNEQLCEDLPSGRFITAWIGVIDAERSVIESFSAGQAPLLIYRAADDSFELHEADMPPFGVVDHFEVEETAAVSMAPGDLYAVISDGIFEAVNDDHELFGTERVQEVIRRHRDASATGIMEAIRAAVDDFAGSRPPDDDRTAVLIKSVPREAGA